MFKNIIPVATFNERTGYGIHASRFFPCLEELNKSRDNGNLFGDVHISLLDVVSASNATTFPERPSILFSVWESTEYPEQFVRNLINYDQLWVASEAQRSWSIAQGIPEEFVKVVPEGVDPDVYKPLDRELSLPKNTFDFVHVGQWQPRKSTLEICQSFIKAFPSMEYPDVRLNLSADTLFPSDEYKSTEERLKAYGVNDPRIIPVHFEERPDYIKRLQQAHCFVTCARSEGWNLPLGEAIACGIPSITADFGGSTEYAQDSIVVRIKELRKPHGIYGGWDVPGQWGEPDYDHLIEQMRDVYKNYPTHKAKALKNAEVMRTKFSWKAAAEKAYKHLEELHISLQNNEQILGGICNDDLTPEKDIVIYARKRGFEIKEMRKRKEIFTIDAHPSSQEKLDTLMETIAQVKRLGFEVLVSSHLPVPAPVMEMCDYFIYDKKDILSGDDKPVYMRVKDGKQESVQSSISCHALAAIHNVRNSLDFCLNKYDWVYHMTSDTEVDLEKFIDAVRKSDKDIVATKWENGEGTFSGQLYAGKTEVLDLMFPRMETWESYVNIFQGDKFCCEKGFYKIASKVVGLEKIEFVDIDMGNRFDQLDRDAWKDDVFEVSFIDGPFLNIKGISLREYDVEYSHDGISVYRLNQKCGMWSRPSTKYFQNWKVTAKLNGELKFEHIFNPEGKKILISMGSKALGDTIAWMPYIDEFRKKYNCKVVCSGWWQEIFDYPEIEFVKPGALIQDVYASYSVGCYDDQLDKNVRNWRLTNLQQVASDILGLTYAPIRARIKVPLRKVSKKPYVCFSEFSTMRNKLWNREGAWQKVVNHLKDLDYDVVSVSNEPSQLEGIIKHNGQSIQNTIADIAGCEFYIGLNHGPSWVAYALGIPYIMITGVSEDWNDAPNPYRIAINNEVCGVGCFNDPSLEINRGWEWCGRNKDYICTSAITEEMVYDMINKLREGRIYESAIENC